MCACCKKPIKGLIVSFHGADMCQPCKDRTVSFLLAIAELIGLKPPVLTSTTKERSHERRH